jgi:hypothetical protein
VRRLIFSLLLALAALGTGVHAQPYDRIGSLAENPISAVSDDKGDHGMLVELVRALDRVTHSSTQIAIRPFARSLMETASGKADFHLPLIQSETSPPPEGLAYVTEVDIGQIPFVIYSRKTAPLDAKTVSDQKYVMTEPGHAAIFPFPVVETRCLSCSLDMIMDDKADALIVPGEIIDPLLADAKYKGIHRAFYASFPVRALVPVNADSAATRRYLIDGITQLKRTGELWKITGHQKGYTDWQP